MCFHVVILSVKGSGSIFSTTNIVEQTRKMNVHVYVTTKAAKRSLYACYLRERLNLHSETEIKSEYYENKIYVVQEWT